MIRNTDVDNQGKTCFHNAELDRFRPLGLNALLEDIQRFILWQEAVERRQRIRYQRHINLVWTLPERLVVPLEERHLSSM